MKVRVLSDLHTEFEDFVPPSTDADVNILAGDIGVGMAALNWIHLHFPTQVVVYVLGNHEYYRHELRLLEKMKSAAQSNVHILENESITLGGVRFLGATLWTDFALHGEAERVFSMHAADVAMTDFRLIKIRNRRFSAADSAALHHQSVLWLSQQLQLSESAKTVVVTHHGPSELSVADRFKGDRLSPAFASRLEPLIKMGRPALWVHGHMHDAVGYQLNWSLISLENTRNGY